MPALHCSLSKWYLDAVNEAGDAFIGYAAHLRLGVLRVRYRSVLWSPAAGTRRYERHTLLPTRPPRREPDGSIHWACGPLRLDARWQPDAPPVRRRLYDGAGASVVWDCVAPAARAWITLGEARLAGRGYGERLLIRGRPWRLPVDRLLWGRFAGPGGAVVWIDWQGPAAVRLLVTDGRVHHDPVIGETGVEAPSIGGRLTLGPSRPLHRGTIAQAVAGVPGLAWILPRRFRRGEEVKRISRARWTTPSSPPAEGWVIHEVVQWRSPGPA